MVSFFSDRVKSEMKSRDSEQKANGLGKVETSLGRKMQKRSGDVDENKGPARENEAKTKPERTANEAAFWPNEPGSCGARHEHGPREVQLRAPKAGRESAFRSV
jgi:hypothetical protein